MTTDLSVSQTLTYWLVSLLENHVSGQLAIRMDDGAVFVAGPGDVTALPAGHHARVAGDEPAVTVDWFGAGNYGR